jgi:hypothetical protein
MILQSNKKVDNAAKKSTSGYTLLKSDITLGYNHEVTHILAGSLRSN